jgi:hypothetical protein
MFFGANFFDRIFGAIFFGATDKKEKRRRPARVAPFYRGDGVNLCYFISDRNVLAKRGQTTFPRGGITAGA